MNNFWIIPFVSINIIQKWNTCFAPCTHPHLQPFCRLSYLHKWHIIMSPFLQTIDFIVILGSLLSLTFHIPSILSSISSTFKIYFRSNNFSAYLSVPLQFKSLSSLSQMTSTTLLIFSLLSLFLHLLSILHRVGKVNFWTHNSGHIIPAYSPLVMSHYTQNKIYFQTVADKTIHFLVFPSLYNLPLACLAIPWIPQTFSNIWALHLLLLLPRILFTRGLCLAHLLTQAFAQK